MTEKKKAPLTGGAANSAKVELHTVEKDSTKQRTGQGRRFRDFHMQRTDPLRFAEFGSMERIEAVDRLCDETEETLKPCPFCGGKAAIRATFGYCLPGVTATCTHCRGGTGVFTQGKNLFTGKYETIEDCIETAAKRWNMRGGKDE